MGNNRRQYSNSPELSSISLAWVLAGMFHLLTFRWILPTTLEGTLYAAAILSVFFKPSSLLRFTAFLCATALVLFLHYEKLSNHLVLEFWIVVSILISFIPGLSQFQQNSVNSTGLIQRIAPLVRIQYLLLFCFAAFSKLNTAFFNTDSSCAALFISQTIEALRFETLTLGFISPDNLHIQIAAIYLTFGTELLIPCLLYFRRTRSVGLRIALLFHFAMGFIPVLGISSFSALSFVLLLFFFPSRAYQYFSNAMVNCSRYLGRSRLQRSTSKIAIAMVTTAVIAIQHRYIHPAAYLANAAWIAIALPFLYLAFRALRTVPSENSIEPAGTSLADFIPRPRYLATLSLPVFILGLLPYLGFQTQGSFTMFSNLRILGGQPNHFFSSGPLFNAKSEFVKVLGTNHPELTKYPNSNLILTDHELRRKIAHTDDDFYVLCEYKEEAVLIGRFRGQLTLHPLLEALPAFPDRFIRFRDISTQTPCQCTW